MGGLTEMQRMSLKALAKTAGVDAEAAQVLRKCKTTVGFHRRALAKKWGIQPDPLVLIKEGLRRGEILRSDLSERLLF